MNRARVVHAWFGEFASKLMHYPIFSERRSWGNTPWYGNVSNILQVKHRLKCRPFAWFLRRFKGLYEDGGLIPAEVFMIQEKFTNLCLQFDGSAGTSFTGGVSASLVSCTVHSDRMYWHLGNKDLATRSCCGGLRAWNTDQCLSGLDVDSNRLKTSVCDAAGGRRDQSWRLHEESGQLRQADRCLGLSDGQLVMQTCASLESAHESRWAKLSSFVPLERQLYDKAQKQHPESFSSAERQLARLAKLT